MWLHSAEGALIVGGAMTGKKGSATTGEYLGTPDVKDFCVYDFIYSADG